MARENPQKIQREQSRPKTSTKVSRVLYKYASVFSWGIGGAVLLVGFFIFILPKIEEDSSRERIEVDRLLAENEKKGKEIATIEDFVAKHRFLIGDLNRVLEYYLPHTIDKEGIFVTLKDIADRSGGRLQSVSVRDRGSFTQTIGKFDPFPPELHAVEINFSIATLAGYQTVKQILEGIEKSERLLHLEAFTFQPEKANQVKEGERLSETSLDFRAVSFYIAVETPDEGVRKNSNAVNTTDENARDDNDREATPSK